MHTLTNGPHQYLPFTRNFFFKHLIAYFDHHFFIFYRSPSPPPSLPSIELLRARTPWPRASSPSPAFAHHLGPVNERLRSTLELFRAPPSSSASSPSRSSVDHLRLQFTPSSHSQHQGERFAQGSTSRLPVDRPLHLLPPPPLAADATAERRPSNRRRRSSRRELSQPSDHAVTRIAWMVQIAPQRFA